jgi:hypothetical protein
MQMTHPLEFVPLKSRKPLFLTFLVLTLILFAVFRVLDAPLQTDYAPNGIVSFELAGSPQNAAHMVLTWSGDAMLNAAFGLGIDYLFMPIYALALAFATLLAAGRHGGWLKSLGVVAGFGAVAAPLFDAVENYALFKILLGAFESPYPEIAFYCALIKFGLLVFGLAVAILGGLVPRAK